MPSNRTTSHVYSNGTIFPGFRDNGIALNIMFVTMIVASVAFVGWGVYLIATGQVG